MNKEKIGRNDLCPCGSGKKYKKCCMDKDLKEGATYYKKSIEKPKDKLTLKKNTLDFIEYTNQYVGIDTDSKKGTISLPERVDSNRIKKVYESLNTFFPHDVDHKKIYDECSTQTFSGLYWGSPDTTSLINYIARYALYTSNILITNPFCDMMIYQRDSSPLKKPEAWTQVTMNQAIFLNYLKPWIKKDIITVLPPIRWFDYEFHDKELVKISEKRVESYDESFKTKLFSRAYLDFLKEFPPEHMESVLKKSFHNNPPPEMVGLLKDYTENEFNKDPLRYKWSMPSEGMSSIVKTGSGNSLEAALFTADFCDSYLLFGDKIYRDQFDKYLDKESIENESLSKLSRAFSELEFSFLNHVSLDFILKQREDGRLDSLRNFLIKIWSSIGDIDTLKNKDVYKMYKDELYDQYDKYKREWNEIDKLLFSNMGKATIIGGIAMLSGQIDFRVALGGFAIYGIEELIKAYRNRKETKRLPIGIFLDLEKKSR